jgi:hypothetical protein
MPMVYTTSLATAGNLTTNGSANVETDAFFLKPGATRSAYLQAIYVAGKGAGLTAISGISFRVIKFATASTAGTGMTPSPKDPGMQAAAATAASRPTAGATRTNHLAFGCGAAGPGGWIAPNQDSMIVAPAGNAGSIDMMDSSGTVSLAYEFSFEHQE